MPAALTGGQLEFTFSSEQDELRQLARTIIADHCDHSRLRELEKEGSPFDGALWRTLAGANLLGIPVPEAEGGLGLGVLETCILLEEVGRHVAPVPALTLALGALPLARLGRTSGHRELLGGMASGSAIVTAALEERGLSNLARPGVRAVPDGPNWRLTGTKEAVPWGTVADRVLVTASLPAGDVAVFVVDPNSAATEMAPAIDTSGHPRGQLRMEGTPVAGDDLLAGEGPGDAFSWLRRYALAATCALGAGVMEGGLRVTADYIAQREQFGRPVATFQGVAMRIADAYIDTQAVWVTTWSAIWRLAEGMAADEALCIAKFWVADGGQRAAHAFQHLHGGIGVDEDYPIHRYFTWCKALELGLGGATQQLLALGDALATEEDRRREVADVH